MGQPTLCSTAHLLQSSTHFAQTRTIETNPREDQTHNTSLVLHNLEACHTAAVVATDVAISIGRSSERAHRARTCGMPPPTPHPLQQFGALVFGDHALNLQQKIVLCSLANRAIEKHHLCSHATELVDQYNLMGITARQPVRCMYVDAIDASGRYRIAQLLKCRTLQVRAAVAFIDVGVVRLERIAVSGDALLEGSNLTVNRMLPCLSIARHSRIKSSSVPAHLSPLRVFAFAVFASRSSALLCSARWRARRTSGTKSS
jgi:hypothetical protein